MNKELIMKNVIFLLCTVAFVGLATPTVRALETPVQIPVVTADSESFELVGRLEAEGLVIFIDRAASNQPVLNAKLEVEQAGKNTIARFRPASGDYLIADADWLKPLRQPGEYALAFTLQADDEADLLAADFVVSGMSIAPQEKSSWRVAGVFLLAFGGMVFWWRSRKTGKRSAA
jgi:hypothetical protein